MAMTTTDAGQNFIERIPHIKELGMKIVHASGEMVEILMPYDERLVGDPETGVIHGGAVSVLMDTCGGASVLCHPNAPPTTATIDLRIDYMRPATPGQAILARAVCHHITRSVAFIRATAFDDDRDRPVATATGAFTVTRA